MLEYIIPGFIKILYPSNFIFMLFGLFLGILAGAVPGISGTMMLAVVIPLTFGMDPTSAIIFLIGIYVGSVYSGSITGILFRIPGAPEAVATTIDGYELNKKGMASQALGVDIFSSASGGIFATIVLIFVSPQLAKVALSFGPAEFFAACVLALTVISSLGGKNIIKAFITGIIGLFLATIGIDEMSGVERYTYGNMTLKTGMSFVPALIGLFAMSEVFRRAQEVVKIGEIGKKFSAILPSFKLMANLKWVVLQSSVIGTIIGILPGIGATTAAIVGYSEAARWSKEPEKFGTGVFEGVAAPEAANNAGAIGSLIPFLTLGIPGGANTALLIGAFIIHNLRPGPLLFVREPVFVSAIFAGTLLSNILIIFMGKIFIRYFVKAVSLPYTVLGPCIVILAIVGSFGVRNSMGDVIIMFLFGLGGYFLEKYEFPVTPMVIGLVLGPIAESSLRRTMLLGNNDILYFFTKPISAALLIAAFISLIFPILKKFSKNIKKIIR
jgi:putative tricarboxylic transport membrane protein